MTCAELQIAYTIKEHLLRQSYLTQKQQSLLHRVQRQIVNCMREITIRDGKKNKD